MYYRGWRAGYLMSGMYMYCREITVGFLFLFSFIIVLVTELAIAFSI